ncbi:hypothetical protein JMJ35_010558 [Cladonia borealis]|uniref:NAD-dependent epimerase/dehydratase domain-containing protein n=1 Tax=Cladonia borealis TaxID=184061 RepID=A0AA39QQ65_9LECA|nr:hypothetical protein JMJ35_010558 [Cladonia borealis]
MLPNLKGRPPVIPPRSIILVTGVNGYIASHVADHLIQAGYIVRGTTRNIAKTAWVKDMFDAKYGGGKFEVVVVEDMAEHRALDKACKGVVGVAHVASIVTFDPDPNEVLPGAVRGALNAVFAASRMPSIKRVVCTSSSTAILLPKPNVELNVSTEDWNIEARLGSVRRKQDGGRMDDVGIHEDGKTWLRPQHRIAKFEFWSDLLGPSTSITGGLVRNAYYGDIAALKNMPPQWMVDVKDTARLHVAALIDPEVENERILAFAYPYNCNDILKCLRKLYPDKKFPNNIENDSRDLSKVDNRRREELLKKFGRPGWTGLEESIQENTAWLG